MAQPTQCVGERFQVRGPVGQDQAVPALRQGGGHVSGDLPVALFVGDEVLVDDANTAWGSRAGHDTTAAKWAHQAGGDWTRYAAELTRNPPHQQ